MPCKASPLLPGLSPWSLSLVSLPGQAKWAESGGMGETRRNQAE